MMKNFNELSKDRKREVKKEFISSNESIVYKKANKILVLSIIGIIIACLASLFDYVYKTGIVNYILDGLLFIFSLIFLIKMIIFKKSELNRYFLNRKK